VSTIQANKYHDEAFSSLVNDEKIVMKFTNLDSDTGPLGVDFYGLYLKCIEKTSKGRPYVDDKKTPAS